MNGFADQLFDLNLLPYASNLKQQRDKLWDPTRGKWVARTPEEIVRQSMIHYLTIEHKFGVGRMRTEWGFTYNNMDKRLDLLLYDKKAKPFFLVECKSWNVSITSKSVKQVGLYNTVIEAPYVAICNGVSILLSHFDKKTKKTILCDHWPARLSGD